MSVREIDFLHPSNHFVCPKLLIFTAGIATDHAIEL